MMTIGHKYDVSNKRKYTPTILSKEISYLLEIALAHSSFVHNESRWVLTKIK